MRAGCPAGPPSVIDAFASRSHYLDHIAPVWKALSERGTLYVPARLHERAEGMGLEATVVHRRLPPLELALVASAPDLFKVNTQTVLMEHGSGQMYGKGHPAYAGGAHRQRVVLFLCPNEAVATANRTAYPETPAVVVGCPKLDRWYGHTFTGTEVAVSFHFEANVVPEARSAFTYYRHVLPDLAREFPLIGHAHPRQAGRMQAVCERVGIEFVPEFDDVLERARLYVVDNSSTGWEFMATDRPVVWLNAPFYRRDVHHGMRFWDLASSGVQVDDPRVLSSGVRMALADFDWQRERRHEAVLQVYGVLDGKAAQRAAQAIEGWRQGDRTVHFTGRPGAGHR